MKKGKQAGGRAANFRLKYVSGLSGILSNTEPNATWRLLRRISQRHLKQFGDGMSRIESVISDVGDDMFKAFADSDGTPTDPKQIIEDTVLKSITFLLSGKKATSEDRLVRLMKAYEKKVRLFAGPNASLATRMFDWLPWLRFLGLLPQWRNIADTAEAGEEVWQEIQNSLLEEAPETSNSLARLLLSHCEGASDGDSQQIGTNDAKATCTNLLLAGMITTSATLYGFTNILAHQKEVQQKLADEISSVVPDGELIRLRHKPEMPYLRASILEALRYMSVVPLGVPHRACADLEIQGFRIRKDTGIITNLWALHHDRDFWGDPEMFRPERFLDSSGDIVPADHPNRRHLMPFGAGTRVCIGETLAQARLFVWIATLVQRFHVLPASDVTLTEMNQYDCKGSVMASKPYLVKFLGRKAPGNTERLIRG